MLWLSILRGIDAFVCLCALWYMATKAYHQWSNWNTKTQTHWWAFFGWIFVGFEGSIESIILHTRPGPRIVIASIVMMWTLITLVLRGEVHFHSEDVIKDLRNSKKEV